MISFFQTNEDGRLTVQTALYQIGKTRNHSVYTCMDFMKNLKRESNLLHYASAAALFAAIVFACIKPVVGVFAVFVVIICNFITYLKRKGEMEAYISTVGSLIRLLCSSETLASCQIPELAKYTERLKSLNRHFASFKRNYWIVASKKPTGDLLDSIMTYFRMLFHLHLMKFNSMLKVYDKHAEELKQLYETAGYLDALCAAASFRALLGKEGYCIPELLEGTVPLFEGEELYHPLLDNPVKNSISAKKSLSGQN